MKQEIATLTDDQKTDSDKLSALQLLRELVRPIDNANGESHVCEGTLDIFETLCTR